MGAEARTPLPADPARTPLPADRGRASVRAGRPGALVADDPADTVARVAVAKREVLLRVYRRRLRREDLEDCYSQATLELLARARRGTAFESPQHVANALEQKFASRVNDRHRAVGGRSATETALAHAVSLSDEQNGTLDFSDHAPGVAERVQLRHELRRLREIADELTPDQRLVLVSQVTLGMDSAEFCAKWGWSSEKFRKVAQRARAKLRSLLTEYETGQRCRQLSQDVIAYSARVASQEQERRVSLHLENCPGCAARLRVLDRSARQVAAVLPAPALATGGVMLKLLASAAAIPQHLASFPHRLPRALLRFHPLRDRLHLVARHQSPSPRSQTIGAGARAAGGAAGGGGAMAGASGSVLGVAATKLGVTALCVAGAAGGYAVCQREGWLPWAPRVDHHSLPRFRHRHAGFSRSSNRGKASKRGGASLRAGGISLEYPVPNAGTTVELGRARPGAGAVGNVRSEFGLPGAGRRTRRRAISRARRRAGRAARAARRARGAGPRTAGPGRASTAATRASGGGGGGGGRRSAGDFLGGGRGSRTAARHEFGF